MSTAVEAPGVCAAVKQRQGGVRDAVCLLICFVLILLSGTGLAAAQPQADAGVGEEFYRTDAGVSGPAAEPETAPPAVQTVNSTAYHSFSYTPKEPNPGEPVTFDATGLADSNKQIEEYRWYVDGKEVGTRSYPRYKHVFRSEGEFEVMVVIVDEDGQGTRFSQTVTVNNISPNASIQVDTAVPQTGQPTVLNATASTDPDGKVITYSWKIDGNTVSSEPFLERQFSRAGYHTVELTVGDNNRETATVSRQVYVTNTPTPVVEINPSPIVTGEVVTFDASESSDSDGAITAFNWTFDGTRHTTGAVVTETFDRDGKHTGSVTIVDTDGATVTKNFTFVVHAELRESFELSPASARVGEPVEFAVAEPAANTTYQWDLDDDGEMDRTTRSGTLRFDSPGNHTIRMRAGTDAGVIQVVERTVNVRRAVSTDLTASGNTPAVGGQTTLRVNVTNHRSETAVVAMQLNTSDTVVIWGVDGARLASPESTAPMRIKPGETHQVTLTIWGKTAGQGAVSGTIDYEFEGSETYRMGIREVTFEIAPNSDDRSAEATDSTAERQSPTAGDGPGFGWLAFALVTLLLVGIHERGRTEGER